METNASADCFSGTCGETLTYSFKQKLGVLTISGKGNMNHYSRINKTPWDSFKGNINVVIIENGVASIGARAFDNCKSLTSLTIPNSLTSIGAFAFCYCTKITSIRIPFSVDNIGDGAFSHCYSLTTIEIDKNNTKYKFTDGALLYFTQFQIDKKTFSEISLHTYLVTNKEHSYTIPPGVTCIRNWAFDSNKNLISLIFKCIPSKNSFDSREVSIGEKAFSKCENLSNVAISYGTSNADADAKTEEFGILFDDCSKLRKVLMSNPFTVISEYGMIRIIFADKEEIVDPKRFVYTADDFVF